MSDAASGRFPPAVSVIIPVRNDAVGCRAVLSCLARQTFPARAFDVIIGDDGSRPGSLADLPTTDGRVRVVSSPPRTSYDARNRAAALSGADILAFCDSDCRPEPDWLRAGVDALAHADLVAGEVALVGPAQPTVWTVLSIDSFLDQSRNVRRQRAVTANLFVRRADFERWGRFDGSLASGGDFDFVERAVSAGARVVYAADAVVRHPTIDSGALFLTKVWRTNRWAAIRRRRSGRAATATTVLGCVPVIGGVLVRRESLRPVTHVDRARLHAAGVPRNPLREAGAVAMYYLFVSQVANAARLAGWINPGKDGADTEP